MLFTVKVVIWFLVWTISACFSWAYVGITPIPETDLVMRAWWLLVFVWGMISFIQATLGTIFVVTALAGD